jgi:hypothetical protein
MPVGAGKGVAARGDRSQIAPTSGSANTVRITDSETRYGNSWPGRMSRNNNGIRVSSGMAGRMSSPTVVK